MLGKLKRPRPGRGGAKPDEPCARLVHYDLTDKAMTYFPRKTFWKAAEALGIDAGDSEFETVAEMVRALAGTGLSVAIAVLPFDDVCDICDGRKRLVCLGPPAGEEGADHGAGDRADDAEGA